MTFATFTPPIPPSPGTDSRPEVNIKSVQFGDGYAQEAPAGLNHIREVATLQWDVLTEAQADELVAFFYAHMGVTPFLYALRGDVARKWTCREWSRKRGSPNVVMATFRERF